MGSSQNNQEMEALAAAIPDTHQLLLMTDYLDDTKAHSYSCAVFVNYETKEIIFANAGSRFGMHEAGLRDIKDDIKLVLKDHPFKMTPAAELNRIILDSLGNEAKDFKFHYTGHSLGGASAELSAADMDIELRKRELKQPNSAEQITAITFENPGTKPIIDKMYKDANLNFENKKDAKFYTFNNRVNAINSLNPQAGETYTITPNNQTNLFPTPVQLMFSTIANYCSKIGANVTGAICQFLSMGGKQLKADHKLEHFETVFVKNEGKIVPFTAIINDRAVGAKKRSNIPDNSEQKVIGNFTEKIIKEKKQSITIGSHRNRH